MDKMDGLRAGVAEMRSVALRLNQWANDLEASLHDQASPKEEAGSGKALTIPEVRAVLAEKCAAGFGTQVKGLIESYGASTLKDVPAEKYEELLEAVRGLGDADAG